MTDASDRLAARFAVLADPLDDSDWLDVRRRADGRRPQRAWLVAALAATLAVLVVGSALAYYGDLVDFASAEKAPRETVEFFGSLGVGAPPGMDPEALAGEARRIEVAGLNGKRRVLFVAPTKAGGYCYTFDDHGGCDRLGTVPLNPTWTARSISGSVNGRYGSKVEIRYPDGSVVRPLITWVSSPIDRGFFFHAPASGPLLASIVALDDDGEVVTEHRLDFKDVDGPPPDAITGEKTVGASISTRAGDAVIWVAPTRYEGRCSWFELRGRVEGGICQPKGYNEGAALRFHETTETLVVQGRVADRYAALELRYADGASQRVPAGGGFVLAEIPQRHLERGARLIELAWYDRGGREITSWKYVPPPSRAEQEACRRASRRGQPCRYVTRS